MPKIAKPERHRQGWRIRWIDETGARRCELYDEFRDAAFKLREHQQRAAETRRGLRAPMPRSRTFAELRKQWLNGRAAHKRSRNNDESMIRVHLEPAFGGLRLEQITVERIDALSASMQRAPNTIHHVLSLLGAMLRYALELGWIASMPKIRKPKKRLLGQNFRYLRTDDEIGRFLRAAGEEGELCFVVYATAIYTGMRAGELAGLRWDDVDFDRRLICVQRSYDGPTKSGDLRWVPILDPLLPLLRAWRLRIGGGLVFPTREGKTRDQSSRIFQETLHRVLKEADLPPKHITFHGLRHTFASHFVMRGGDLFRLQKILGHSEPTMTMRYAHLSPHAFAEDWSRLGTAAPANDAGRVTPIAMARTSE